MLYIVSTPIGNLGDLSLRAREVLVVADYILCEDTRVTGNMLKNLGILTSAKLISFYDEVEEQKIPDIIKLLEGGYKICLVSDAGTPVISDPGYRLVTRCRKEGLKMTAIPGPSAVLNALVLSGLPSGRFSYLGFLPKKSGERKKILEDYKQTGGSKVVFESPYRIEVLIEEVLEIYGEETSVVICREMTKLHEEVIWGKITEVRDQLNKKNLKGELVVVFC